MSAKPEALRLAEWIESDMTCDGDAQIAAELRRLHGMVERLSTTCETLKDALASSCDEARDQLWESGGVAGCSRALSAEFQRDALLEALRTLLSYANVLEMRLLDADGEHRAMQQARAAIKAVEERK